MQIIILLSSARPGHQEREDEEDDEEELERCQPGIENGVDQYHRQVTKKRYCQVGKNAPSLEYHDVDRDLYHVGQDQERRGNRRRRVTKKRERDKKNLSAVSQSLRRAWRKPSPNQHGREGDEDNVPQ